MLKRLYIKNYALIDEIHVEFGDGFTVVTGETGAGKSIILGALSLVLGERADSDKIREGEKKCVIEAEFDLPKRFDRSFFQENELDYESSSILRRELLASGKSRAFVNDTPVKLGTIKELTSTLIDIHSQNEHISLNESEYQLRFLDEFADLVEIREEHVKLYQECRDLQTELDRKKEEQAQRIQNRDFWQFQFEELDQAGLKEGEVSKLEDHLKIISSSEELKSSLYQVSAEIGEHDQNIISSLRALESQLTSFRGMQDSLDEIIRRLESSRIELEDIHSEIDSLSSSVDFDQGELQKTEDRLNLLNDLLQKHRLKTSQELIELKDELEQKLSGLEDSDEELQELESKLLKLEKERKKIASVLSKKRTTQKANLESGLKKLLEQMSIPAARVFIQIDSVDAGPYGEDKVSYLFAANEGQRLQPIQKVASGGERSRLMLALRYVLSKKSELPAMILDEIDTGISGEVARQVAEVLRRMSERMQVISITHLPQIAAKGEDHKFVYKEGGRTLMRSLDEDGRILEIAQMLSGAEPTEEARSNARQLLH